MLYIKGKIWQNLGLRSFNVLPATVKNITNSQFKVILKWRKALSSVDGHFKTLVNYIEFNFYIILIVPVVNSLFNGSIIIIIIIN